MMTPPSPCTGSRITAAVSRPMARPIAAASPYGTKATSCRSGWNGSRNTALPVTDRLPIDFPWNEFSVEMKPRRRVNRRASLSAPSTASVPLLQKNVRRSLPGVTSASRRPASAVIGFTRYWLWSGIRSSCSLTAATTSGWRWPSEKMP